VNEAVPSGWTVAVPTLLYAPVRVPERSTV
jgi:hypothetical protein